MTAKKITADSLRRDRDRRARERTKLADAYDRAADALDEIGGHREAAYLLRSQARGWRR